MVPDCNTSLMVKEEQDKGEFSSSSVIDKPSIQQGQNNAIQEQVIAIIKLAYIHFDNYRDISKIVGCDATYAQKIVLKKYWPIKADGQVRLFNRFMRLCPHIFPIKQKDGEKDGKND